MSKERNSKIADYEKELMKLKNRKTLAEKAKKLTEEPKVYVSIELSDKTLDFQKL